MNLICSFLAPSKLESSLEKSTSDQKYLEHDLLLIDVFTLASEENYIGTFEDVLAGVQKVYDEGFCVFHLHE